MDSQANEILLVDDNPENLRVLSKTLENEGYVVRAVNNGKQALASVEASEPHLLLLDVHMPEMDGFEVCRILKKESQYEKLPVIFLSALDDSFNKVKGFEAGGIDFMTKPFDIEEVKVRIKTHLKLRVSLEELDLLREELREKDKKIEKLESKLGLGSEQKVNKE